LERAFADFGMIGYGNLQARDVHFLMQSLLDFLRRGGLEEQLECFPERTRKVNRVPDGMARSWILVNDTLLPV